MIPGHARIAGVAILCCAMLAAGDMAFAQPPGGSDSAGGGSVGGAAVGGSKAGAAAAGETGTGTGTSAATTGAGTTGAKTGAGTTATGQTGTGTANSANKSADPNSSSNPANNPAVNGNASNSQQQPVKSGGGRNGKNAKKETVVGAATGIDTCMAQWEEALHMTKNEWRAACIRTRNGIESPSANGSTTGISLDRSKVKTSPQ